MISTGGRRVLVVDDDAEQRMEITHALTDAGYDVSRREDGIEGLIAAETERPALVVLDWSLLFVDGPIFTHALRTGMHTPPPVIALAGPDVDPEAVLRAGASACVPLPLDPARLVRVVDECLDGDPASRIAAAAWNTPPGASRSGSHVYAHPHACHQWSRRRSPAGHAARQPAAVLAYRDPAPRQDVHHARVRAVINLFNGRRMLLVNLFAAQAALMLRMTLEGHPIAVPHLDNMINVLSGLPVLAVLVAVARAARVRV